MAAVLEETQLVFETSPADWDTLRFDHLGHRLVLFTGSSTGSSSESWCPDCTRALPVVLETVLERGLPIAIVGVGERDDWKLDARGNDNKFRVKEGLTGVPTLRVYGSNGTMVGSLGSELEDEQDPQKMKMVLQDFLTQKAGSIDCLQVSKALQQKGLLTFASPADWDNLSLEKSGPHFVLFTASSTGSSLLSWCPDCRRAVPVVLQCASEHELPVTLVGVGERDDWKLDARGATNKFRVKEGLTGVPTLRLIAKDGSTLGALGSELEDEQDPEKMKLVLGNFVKNRCS